VRWSLIYVYILSIFLFACTLIVLNYFYSFNHVIYIGQEKKFLSTASRALLGNLLLKFILALLVIIVLYYIFPHKFCSVNEQAKQFLSLPLNINDSGIVNITTVPNPGENNAHLIVRNFDSYKAQLNHALAAAQNSAGGLRWGQTVGVSFSNGVGCSIHLPDPTINGVALKHTMIEWGYTSPNIQEGRIPLNLLKAYNHFYEYTNNTNVGNIFTDENLYNRSGTKYPQIFKGR